MEKHTTNFESEITHGTLKGEQCNRDGCTGIIDEYKEEGSCSCHINPPCSHCTTDTAYCPECDWQCEDDIKPVDPEIAKSNNDFYSKLMKENEEAEQKFQRMFSGKEKATELVMRFYSHSNSSMLKKGVFPPGSETSASIFPKVVGTFGGRFQMFDSTLGRFEYIAYTD